MKTASAKTNEPLIKLIRIPVHLDNGNFDKLSNYIHAMDALRTLIMFSIELPSGKDDPGDLGDLLLILQEYGHAAFDALSADYAAKIEEAASSREGGAR